MIIWPWLAIFGIKAGNLNLFSRYKYFNNKTTMNPNNNIDTQLKPFKPYPINYRCMT